MESNKAEAQEKIITALRDNFESEVIAIETPYDYLTVVLKKERIVEVIEFLHSHQDTRFQFLTTLFGVHYPDIKSIAVVYQLHNLVDNLRIRLKIFLSEENPTTPTLTHLFAGANWMERETYDFFGVQFEGHPNLTRILNVDDMIMFPLLKTFPLEDQVREDKSDKMFGR